MSQFAKYLIKVINSPLTLILLFAFIVFSPSLKNQLLYWDDIVLIKENPDIRHLDFYNLQQIFQRKIVGVYAPLTVLSFAVEYQFSKLNPFLYHLDNIFLHLAVVGLIFILAQRLGLSQKSSIWATLIFAIHPLNVESVAWVSERKDVLFTLFYILALISYLEYLKNNRFAYYISAILCGLFSILAKPMAYSLPIVLWLLDFLQNQKLSRKIILNKIPFFLMIGSISLITMESISTSLQYPIGQCVLVWIYSLIFYIYKFVWPWDLNVIYTIPQPISLNNFSYLCSTISLIFLIIFCIPYLKRNRSIFAIISFYLISISIVVIRTAWEFGNNTPIADRFMYLPKLGFCLLLGELISRGIARISVKNTIHFIAFIPLSILIITFSSKTFFQCSIWQNDDTLWLYVKQKSPNERTGYINSGTNYFYQKKYQLALSDYFKAAQLAPWDPKIQFLIGNTYEKLDQIPQAIAAYNESLNQKHDYADVYFYLGNLYNRRGSYKKASENYLLNLKYQPNNSKAYYNLGTISDDQNNINKAFEYYSLAILAEPRYSMALNNRGLIHLNNKEYAAALQDFNKAVWADDENAEAYNNRGTLYSQIGQLPQALSDFNRALIANPNFTTAHKNRDYIQGIIKKQLQ